LDGLEKQAVSGVKSTCFVELEVVSLGKQSCWIMMPRLLQPEEQVCFAQCLEGYELAMHPVQLKLVGIFHCATGCQKVSMVQMLPGIVAIFIIHL